MIRASVRLYLGSETRLAFLEKEVEFVAMPRVGEWLKPRNETIGPCNFRIQEVTHCEGEPPDVMLELWLNDGKPEYSGREDELDEDVRSFVREGWKLRSIKERTGEWWRHARS